MGWLARRTTDAWLVAIGCLVWNIGAVADEAPPSAWQRQVICESVKQAIVVRNSPQLAVSARGRIHVIYLEEAGQLDRIWLASSSLQGMTRELVADVMRQGTTATGVQSIALTLDRQQRPWVFYYTRDDSPAGLTFEEVLAARLNGRTPWTVQTIRRSENRDGGAGLTAPQVLIDRWQHAHVFAYVHNGFREIHRVRHRYDTGRGFDIESLPRPEGKSDSGVVAAAIDARDRIHLLYSSTKALLGGRPEPGYPSACVTYCRWDAGEFTTPQVVAPFVGGSVDANAEVLSLGIGLSSDQRLHGLVWSGHLTPGDDLQLEHLEGQLLDGAPWQRTVIYRESELRGAVFVDVSPPRFDAQEHLHFATRQDQTTRYWRWDGERWQDEALPGELQGFDLLNQTTPLLLIRQGRQLVLWRRG